MTENQRREEKKTKKKVNCREAFKVGIRRKNNNKQIVRDNLY